METFSVMCNSNETTEHEIFPCVEHYLGVCYIQFVLLLASVEIAYKVTCCHVLDLSA